MKVETGQGSVMIAVVAIIAVIIGALAGYFLAPAAPAEGELETVKVAFVCHGSAADPCWMAYHNGAVEMAKRFKNVEVTYRYSEEDIAIQVNMVREEIARGVDAIILSIADANALDAPVQEARNAGIVVIAYDCDDPEGAAGNARQAFITSLEKQGLCYDTSYKRAELAFDYVPEGGHIYFPNCGPGAAWSLASKQGVLDYFEEQGKTINLHEEDISLDLATAESRVTAYILAHRDEIDAIIPAGGLGSIAAVLAEEGIDDLEPGDIPIFSWPHGEVDARGIKEGYVLYGVTDSHSTVGAICLLEAVLAVEHNVGPTDVAMPLFVVDQSNIDKWAEGWEKTLY